MSLIQKLTLFATSAALLFFSFMPFAFAQSAAPAAEISSVRFLAAALSIGLAAAGCGIGQGRAAASAFEGISRNPSAYGKIFPPLLITLAIIESLGIYGLLISLLAIFI